MLQGPDLRKLLFMTRPEVRPQAAECCWVLGRMSPHVLTHLSRPSHDRLHACIPAYPAPTSAAAVLLFPTGGGLAPEAPLG